MGTGSYIGAHTKVFISDTGTRWEIPDRPTNEADGSRRKRWDEEVAATPDRSISHHTSMAISSIGTPISCATGVQISTP